MWDKGFEFSAAAVAADAGVGIGTLYRHFANRDALIEAVLADFLTEVEAELDAVETMEPGVEALGEYVRGLAGAGGRGLADIVLADPESTPGLAARRRDIRSRGGALIARAQETGAMRSDFTLDDLHVFLCVIAGLSADKRVGDVLVNRFIRDHLEGLR
ncbi:AcrR family transcriptional regulator [Gordonia hydrophobica]|nr:AcrR family transcriptional regulator [Gordonia hydrophobica]